MRLENTNKTCCHGSVCALTATMASVRLTAAGECSGCALTAVCGGVTSDIITIAVPPGCSLAVGDRVAVTVSSSAGMIALVVYILVPLMLMLAAAFIAGVAGGGQLAVAVALCAAVAGWYLLLYIFRKRLGRKVRYEIEKLSDE